MGVWGRVKNAVSNFYGGNDEGYDDDDYEEDYDDEEMNEEPEEDDNPSGYGDDNDNPSGYGEDEAPFHEEEINKGNIEAQIEESEVVEKQKLVSPFSKIGQAIMKKEAIIHGCSPRVEMLPCPICHAKSIFMSYRPFDWFPLLVGARIIGVPLYRFYCFNKNCSRSWYKGYVFNCPTEKFQPASAPTKRQFNSM